ncbi:hypothetical protein, partial [Acetobacterium sp.]|uniref:hypothetical protein n=1 Tax=Acetobacterium sp. TaxID=1872094 RepID=UPI0035936F5B
GYGPFPGTLMIRLDAVGIEGGGVHPTVIFKRRENVITLVDQFESGRMAMTIPTDITSSPQVVSVSMTANLLMVCSFSYFQFFMGIVETVDEIFLERAQIGFVLARYFSYPSSALIFASSWDMVSPPITKIHCF